MNKWLLIFCAYTTAGLFFSASHALQITLESTGRGFWNESANKWPRFTLWFLLTPFIVYLVWYFPLERHFLWRSLPVHLRGSVLFVLSKQASDAVILASAFGSARGPAGQAES